MKEGWEVKKLSAAFDIKSSRRVHQSDWRQQGIPFYRAREVVLLSKLGFVNNELFISEELYGEFTKIGGAPKYVDLIVSAVGTLGCCYQVKVDDKFYFKDASVLWFEKKTDINSSFIEYAFKSDSIISQISLGSVGATVGTLTINRAKELKIPIPPLPEQQRIVSIIDKAFEAIDKAIENTQKNLQNAKELFESYLNSVFENGGNWEKKSLNELYQIGSSRRVLKSQWKTEGIPFYRGREITRIAADGFVDNELYISEEHYLELLQKTGVPKTGDIVMTAIGTIGNTHIVRDIDRFYFKDASVLWLKRISQTSSEFTRYYLKSSLFFDQLDKGNGATVDTLTIDKLQNIQLFLPLFDEQKIIVQKLDALQAATKKLEFKCQQKLHDLEELKKSILNKAFAGEL